MFPVLLIASTRRLRSKGIGTLTVDIPFGGMWYAIADAEVLGFALDPTEARELSRVGELIRTAAREQLPCVHPENPDITGVSIVQIAEPWQGVGAIKNAVIVAPGRLDRSATGTGLSARMAALHARGAMKVGDAMTHASVIGSTFDGRIVSETTVAGHPQSSRRSVAAPGLPASHMCSSTRPTHSPRGTSSPTPGQGNDLQV